MQDQKFLKYRSLIVRALSACALLSEGVSPASHSPVSSAISENGTSTPKMAEALQTLIGKIQAHHQDVVKCESNYRALESPIQGPDRSRLTLFVEGNFTSLAVALFEAVLASVKNEDVEAALTKALNLLVTQITQIEQEVRHAFKEREAFFEKLVMVLEVGQLKYSARVSAINCYSCNYSL